MCGASDPSPSSGTPPSAAWYADDGFSDCVNDLSYRL